MNFCFSIFYNLGLHCTLFNNMISNVNEPLVSYLFLSYNYGSNYREG